MPARTRKISEADQVHSSRHLKPGGYFEHLEFSCITSADPNSDNYADKMYTKLSNSIVAVGEEKTGQTFMTMQRMEEYMRGASESFPSIYHHLTSILGSFPPDSVMK